MASSIDISNGRYVQGGTTEVLPNRLGWWERTIMEKMDTDIPFTIDGKFIGRPDLISNEVYGTTDYRWLVLEYNTILDIETELVYGVTIVLPDPSRVL